jgi:hypothetical protein
MPESDLWPVNTSIVLFITATGVIAVCGIAAQTSFLALADILYRKANLEHAAAAEANLVQAAVLVFAEDA